MAAQACKGDPTDGAAAMKNLLGGKGANLAEMCRLGIPVPPGFTISTEACTAYTQLGRQQGRDALLAMIDGEVREGVAAIEAEMGKRFGNAADPLLLSVRSGARASMPGMMDTILNLGLNDEAVAGLAPAAATSASPGTATAASSRCTATW
jgi:pyruvate,orthophosphate dikinase